MGVFDSRQSFKFWKSLKDVYGPTFRITLVGQPKFVVITNPDDIEILYRITMNEPVRPGLYSLKKIRDDAADNFFEKKGGILVENYEEWQRVRSKVQAPMMRPKNIIKYLKEMDNVSKDFTDRSVLSFFKRKHFDRNQYTSLRIKSQHLNSHKNRIY
ncbi:hypothetical protein Anas_04700 [Armadillidium nasatum]|uniref:Uncharacterized protein n=1 Tax=Armadillidium nasatum TaxID=96803 RepID=A0A5N5SS83_9CRUS|nr:hypothetical protein Anas_04700 [Armadillidium nasatum]